MMVMSRRRDGSIPPGPYAPPYKRRAVALAAGSLSPFFDDTYGFSRARALLESGNAGPRPFGTRFPLMLPTALLPNGPGGRAIVEFADRRSPIIQARVAGPCSLVRDFIESGDQQDPEVRSLRLEVRATGHASTAY